MAERDTQLRNRTLRLLHSGITIDALARRCVDAEARLEAVERDLEEVTRLMANRCEKLERERDTMREALEPARELAVCFIDFAKNEVPDEWDGGSLGYSVGGMYGMAQEVKQALAASAAAPPNEETHDA